MLERLFRLSENGTTVRTELLAGLTTFLTMAYIIFVQPAVLSDAGIDSGAALVATCLAAALATMIMDCMLTTPLRWPRGWVIGPSRSPGDHLAKVVSYHHRHRIERLSTR